MSNLAVSSQSHIAHIDQREPNRCAMQIDGEQVWVDIENFNVMPGQRAVIIEYGGRMCIQEVEPETNGFKPLGARTALGERYPTPFGTTARNSVVIVGVVIEPFTGLTIEGEVAA